jgi:hypothetical protein
MKHTAGTARTERGDRSRGSDDTHEGGTARVETDEATEPKQKTKPVNIRFRSRVRLAKINISGG